MESNTKQSLIILLLAANLVMMFYFGTGLMERIDLLDNEVNQMSHRLETEVWRQTDNIIDGVVKKMMIAESPVESMTVNVKYLDPQSLEAEVDVTVFMREINPEASLKLEITDESGREESKLLIYKDSLVREASLSLDIRRDYQIALSETSDGGTKLLTQEAEPLNLRSQYYDNRVKSSTGSGSGSNKGINEEKVFEMEILSEEVMGLKSVVMSAYAGDKLLTSRDVTDELVIGETPEEVRQQMMALNPDYAGATEGGMGYGSATATEVAVPVQKYVEEIEADSHFYLMHFTSIDFKDYDLKRNTNIDFRYEFTFKDGHVELY